MKSAPHGKLISGVEVTNVSNHGFWLLLGGRELFLPFELFPWFKEAQVGHIMNVELPGPDHLYWPDLDVDLSVESIEHPERFPLMSPVLPIHRAQSSPEGHRRPIVRRRARV